MSSLHKAPIELLINIVEKVQQQAQVQQTFIIENQGWQGITFLCCNTPVVTPLIDIVEILSYPKIIPIPGTKKWFKGITNFRGDILPITDLEAFISDEPSNIEREARIFIVKAKDTLVGILVNRILGVERFPHEAESSVPEGLCKGLQRHIEEGVKLGDTVWPLLDFTQLANNPMFLQVNTRA